MCLVLHENGVTKKTSEFPKDVDPVNLPTPSGSSSHSRGKLQRRSLNWFIYAILSKGKDGKYKKLLTNLS